LRRFSAERISQLEALLAGIEVVWPDDSICAVWAQLMTHCRAYGRPSKPQECWVAAVGIHLGARICTLNPQEYNYLPNAHLVPADTVSLAPSCTFEMTHQSETSAPELCIVEGLRWLKNQALVASVVVQYLPPGLQTAPKEVLAAMPGQCLKTHVEEQGGTRQKRHCDVYVELQTPVELPVLTKWQGQVRANLQKSADGSLQQAADNMRLVFGNMRLAAGVASPKMVVADTDALSRIFKGNTQGPALNKLLHSYERRALSFQTAAELSTWILLRAFPSEKIARLEAMLSTFEVLWPDEVTCLLWAQLMHHARSSGRPAGPQDCWVAAAALRHGACLCTTNLKDFDYFPGLRIATSGASCPCSPETKDVTTDAHSAKGSTRAATGKHLGSRHHRLAALLPAACAAMWTLATMFTLRRQRRHPSIRFALWALLLGAQGLGLWSTCKRLFARAKSSLDPQNRQLN